MAQQSTTFSSPHWLSDEEILAKGVKAEEVESYRRTFYQQAFGVEVWYDRLAAHTFPSVFLPLTKDEVAAILDTHTAVSNRDSVLGADDEQACYIPAEWIETLSGLEEKINQKILQLPNQRSAFMKLNTRSPKDVCIYTNDPQQVETQMRLMESFLRESCGEDESLEHRFTVEQVVSAFVKSCTITLRISSGSEAIDLLLQSTRVQQDLSRLSGYGIENIPASLVIREWHPSVVPRNHMEFRGFVYKNQLNAITQYDDLIFHQDIYDQRETLEQRMRTFFEETVKPELTDIESYVIDFFVDVDRVYVIELNPFHNGAGAGLFSWRDDRELFMNGPFEFRILNQSKENPLGYLAARWEKRLAKYVILPPNESVVRSIPWVWVMSLGLLGVALGVHWLRK